MSRFLKCLFGFHLYSQWSTLCLDNGRYYRWRTCHRCNGYWKRDEGAKVDIKDIL